MHTLRSLSHRSLYKCQTVIACNFQTKTSSCWQLERLAFPRSRKKDWLFVCWRCWRCVLQLRRLSQKVQKSLVWPTISLLCRTARGSDQNSLSTSPTDLLEMVAAFQFSERNLWISSFMSFCESVGASSSCTSSMYASRLDTLCWWFTDVLDASCTSPERGRVAGACSGSCYWFTRN